MMFVMDKYKIFFLNSLLPAHGMHTRYRCIARLPRKGCEMCTYTLYGSTITLDASTQYEGSASNILGING